MIVYTLVMIQALVRLETYFSVCVSVVLVIRVYNPPPPPLSYKKKRTKKIKTHFGCYCIQFLFRRKLILSLIQLVCNGLFWSYETMQVGFADDFSFTAHAYFPDNNGKFLVQSNILT